MIYDCVSNIEIVSINVYECNLLKQIRGSDKAEQKTGYMTLFCFDITAKFLLKIIANL